ncbi:acetylornithine aminotransferase [Polymorphobacter multimanifer]|uniref:Acetylornithine aminotransferase n=1 Tax=Polymorphobacter multimanifer TaxID=1070431 RepID=A0A841L4P9_9SPHN|nr:aspartate aminotransferase family protein [Polymorphobacter multimanifer]MBB6225943.1 acetylornithine/N-succinyldiaminopimelate aminotransferase [Polymorphobacter multimanifer]GGI72801.1 acetylornithine aminotransferase [Polymorphobacter multimanifer]
MTITALMPVYGRCDVEPVRGEGCYLYDAQGREWLDFASGIAVNLLGHSHPHLVGAIQKQAATLMHTSNLYKVPAQAALAERLVGLTFADTVFFTNSGAEAIECAVKTCRSFHYAHGNPEKFRILTFSNAFHGRTLATISATNQEKMRKGFEPLPDWFHVLPFNDLDAVAAAIDSSIGGILVEPIQGEGGIRPATPEFLTGLRKLCDEHGILLILDEVQCGVARTGTLFAHEQYGITPDIMAIAKGIGGGFPVGACLATEHAAAGMVIGTHGSTYGGNPLAMAACQAVLDIVTEPAFLAQVRESSTRFVAALEQMIPNHDTIFESVRGMGLMLGLKLKTDSRAFVAHARSHGILAVAAGDNVVRLLPPLIIEEHHIREAVDKLSAAAAAYVPAAAA